MSLDRVRRVCDSRSRGDFSQTKHPLLRRRGPDSRVDADRVPQCGTGWVSVDNGFVVLMLFRLTGLFPIMTDYEGFCPWPSDGLATRCLSWALRTAQ
jgi:hypothetical protein